MAPGIRRRIFGGVDHANLELAAAVGEVCTDIDCQIRCVRAGLQLSEAVERAPERNVLRLQVRVVLAACLFPSEVKRLAPLNAGATYRGVAAHYEPSASAPRCTSKKK